MKLAKVTYWIGFFIAKVLLDHKVLTSQVERAENFRWLSDHKGESQQHKVAWETNFSSSFSSPSCMTSSRVVAVEPKMEHFNSCHGYAVFKKMWGDLTTLPTPGAERTRLSAHPVHIVIETTVQGKHSSNHSYSNPVEN